MNIEEHLKKQDSRLDKIERKLFAGTCDENYKSLAEREELEKSDTDSHQGKKSLQVIEEEIKSHKQNYRENFSKDEERAWYEKKSSLIEELKQVSR